MLVLVPAQKFHNYDIFMIYWQSSENILKLDFKYNFNTILVR